ncbi:MAG TPA: tetratricopeptide repeat protein [Methylovirgula sp.]|nr:tetratricopeptide repeat protein [Methylovirgula sp.]
MTRNEAALAARDIDPAALMRNALEFHLAERYDMARELYQELLTLEPTNAVAWHHLGLIEHAAGHHARAAELISRAVAFRPDYAEAYANLTAVLRTARQLDQALEAARKAIALNPNFAPAHSNLGNILEDRGELELALAAYLEACRLDPYFVEAHTNAAEILRKLKRHAEGLELCAAISAKRPEAAMPHFCAGNLRRDLLQLDEAAAAYRRALALRPVFVEALCNLGNMLLQRGDADSAIGAYRQAIALRPDMAELHCNLGAAYETARRVGEAIASYARALELDPDLIGVRTQLAYMRRCACDWSRIEEETELAGRIPHYRNPIPPFALLNMDLPAAAQRHAARLWAQSLHARPAFDQGQRECAQSNKIRIGYLSADFHRHATAHLIAELFERHDRSRFEIIAYSHGEDDGSEIRYRLGRAVDRFVDLHELDDRAAAQRIYDDRIDILVELKGYTQMARSEIAAFRPAPVQVNYLGYPGTMGAEFIDYIIADPITLPMDAQEFYDEKIVHLPDCYQPNDSRRRVADRTPPRAECGLPDTGFVFCCFNNSYKLTPKFFAIWMRLLAAVPGSVLWLYDANALVKGNLRKEAEKAGIDPARLVFAPRAGVAEHLARQRLADLFLDTLPYNAHTTTSDALWVGLPVVTMIGEAFAGRVAASLLCAAGLPELVTKTPAEYEALALKLAREPALLAEIRAKLNANRPTCPLFDCARYTRHLEAAFTRMWEIWTQGCAPQAFAVAPIEAPAPSLVRQALVEAPSVPAKIEVTPAMVEAGRLVLTELDLPDNQATSHSELVVRIYRAMQQARPK